MITHNPSEVEMLDDVLAESEPVIELPVPSIDEGDISDEVLMQAIAQGNPSALSTLYDRYASIVKALTNRVVHDEAEADDLLQDVFLQVWHQAKNYAPEKGKPIGWIVTLTRRRAIDRLRSRQAYCRAKDRFEVTTARQSEMGGKKQIEEDIHLNDIRMFLRAKLDALPLLQRQVIEMAFYQGMSQREIALATATPLGTIKTRLELGLRKLAESIRGIMHKI